MAVIQVNGREVTVPVENGRVKYTFVSDGSPISIKHLGCIGDTYIHHLQLEEGEQASSFVAPHEERHENTGLFKELKALNLEMTDPHSTFWAKIRLTNEGMLKEFGDGKMTSAIAQSASTIQTRIRNELEERVSGLTQTIRGIQSDVSDKASQSSVTQLSGLINQKVSRSDVEGIIRNSGDSIYLAVKDKLPRNEGGKMTGSEIKSAIELSRDGARISGKNIHLDGEALIDRAVIKSAMVDKLKTANFESGSVTTAIIDAEAVTADKLKVDQALFNKLSANEAYLRTLFAKTVFSTAVQAVDISGTRLKGGQISARNGAMEINLDQANMSFKNNATVEFQSGNNAIVRRRGLHTGFLHIADEPSGGVYLGLGVTSSGDGINSSSSGRFCGMKFFRTGRDRGNDAIIDQAELYADEIICQHAFGANYNFNMDVKKLTKTVRLSKIVRSLEELWRCWEFMLNENVPGHVYDPALRRGIQNAMRDGKV